MSYGTTIRHGAFLIALGLAVYSGAQDRPKAAQAQLPEILRKAIGASPRLRYSGERIIEFRRGSERKRHTEYIVKDGPRFRIDFHAGSEYAGQVIVETGHQRLHFLPDRNEIQVLPPRKDEALARLRSLAGRLGKDRVRFQHTEGDSVAGVRSETVGVFDLRGHLIMRLWIDPRSGLILKRELYDAVGGLVGLLEFSKVNFEPIIRDSDFQIQRASAKRVTPEEHARRLMRENHMLPVFLPEDSGLLLESAKMLDGDRRGVLLLTYHGASGTVSFYQLAAPINPRRLEAQAGPDNRVHIWRMREKTFALVAAMAADELQAIAARVHAR